MSVCIFGFFNDLNYFDMKYLLKDVHRGLANM